MLLLVAFLSLRKPKLDRGPQDQCCTEGLTRNVLEVYGKRLAGIIQVTRRVQVDCLSEVDKRQNEWQYLPAMVMKTLQYVVVHAITKSNIRRSWGTSGAGEDMIEGNI